MKRSLMAAAAAVLALSAGGAVAEPHGHGAGGHDKGRHGGDERGHGGYEVGHGDNGRHLGWRRGHRMRHDEWARGERIDWRAHHLRHPPRGYEWREVDGDYVLAAVATGLIASIIANSR